ncbi:MAG: NAD(+) synthase [Erysipelotrichaceae bacterium]|nr:NAD(+) synthase [Erysipelotrichaceae bacterium]
MKIALGQLNVQSGNIVANIESMKAMIQEAKAKNADIIVFPEMAISGYFLQDKWTDSEFVAFCQSQNETIKGLSDGIGIIWGNVSPMYGGQRFVGHDGRPARFNSAFFAFNQQWVPRPNAAWGQYVKHLLPDYRVFDDTRFFIDGITLSAWTNEDICEPFEFEKDGQTTKISLQVCEDLWDHDYSFSPTQKAIEYQSDLIINISSSPWTRNKEFSRIKQLVKHHEKFAGKMPPFVYVNAVGMQNNGKTVVVFDGNSTLYDRKGVRVDGCNDRFESECKIVDTQDEIKDESVTKNKLLLALLCGIKEFDRQVFPFKPNWLIGVSGGMDSSISAALLSMALGSERIIGINMSTKYNAEITKNNAQILCQRLKIRYLASDIEAMVDSTLLTMKKFGYPEPYASLTVENIQARLRGHCLSTISSIEKAIIINNANKVETALGYCTLYGDTIGALAPLGDCTKMQLAQLGREINEYFEKEIIPENLLPIVGNGEISWQFAPSAELKDAQIDPMKWGYHDWLIQKLTEYPGFQVEKLMEDYLSGNIFETEAGRFMKFYGLDDPQKFIDDLLWVLNSIQNSVYKRIQMPPIIMVSRGSFGQDYRESQVRFQYSDKFNDLKSQIINKTGEKHAL